MSRWNNLPPSEQEQIHLAATTTYVFFIFDPLSELFLISLPYLFEHFKSHVDFIPGQKLQLPFPIFEETLVD